MKHLFLTAIGTILCLTGCSTQNGITFADENWSFSHETGQIVNQDSTLRFTFGDKVLDPGMTLISCQDSLQQYPGAGKYIGSILKTCGLTDAKLMFYAPVEQTIWVELPGNLTDCKPLAISYDLLNPHPRTSWVWNDDPHEGNRKPEEIYSNSFVNKKTGTLLVVDKMTYGKKPMACIHVFQSDNKYSRRLGFTPWYWAHKGNLTDMSCIDILSNWIDGRRTVMFDNYRLGQQTEYRREINRIREELMEIIKLDQEPRNRIVQAWREHPTDTLLHKSIGREIYRNDSINQIKVLAILDKHDLEFGEENEVLWAVIQHSDLELQKKYLPRFIAAVKSGNMKGELVALMQDRIACRSGKPQIYGSQGACDKNGRFVPAEIEDPANVNERRAALGMIPLEEYIELMSRK